MSDLVAISHALTALRLELLNAKQREAELEERLACFREQALAMEKLMIRCAELMLEQLGETALPREYFHWLAGLTPHHERPPHRPPSARTSIASKDGRKISELGLPERLRALASLMHAGSAWGFSGEATWLEEAADKLESTK